jgi:hypothetical protein
MRSCVSRDARSAGLGGETVAYQINDVVFSPNRSMFGGRKWVFSATLDLVVSFGRAFVIASFEETLEEWTGARAVTDIYITPLDSGTQQRCAQRGMILRSFDSKPAFRAFRAGTFFAHRGVSGDSNLGVGQHTSLQNW